MRIIRGKFKTRRYKVPKGFPSRPTTDFAKEGLFNILEHQFLLHDLNILDLCAGTGNISFEFLSREAGFVTAIDSNYSCIRHMKKMAHELDCNDDIDIIKADIIKYLNSVSGPFDIIFADPPYAYEHHNEIVNLVFERDLLTDNGCLIVEHGKETTLDHITQFDVLRKYGGVNFSLFKK